MTAHRRTTRGTLGAGIALVAVAAATLAFPAVARAEPDFQLLLSPAEVTVTPGGTTTLRVGVGAIDGFSSPVSLSVQGLPAGVSGEFSVDPITPPGVSQLVLTAAADAPVTTVALAVTGSGGGTTHVATGRETAPELKLLEVCFGAVAGTVRDRETNAPLAGVAIRLTPSLDDVGPPAATTGADGSYRVDNVGLGPRNADRELFVAGNLLPDYWPARSEETTIGCDRTTQVDLTLVRVRPARLSGTIFEGTPDPTDYSKVIATTTPAAGVTTLINPYFYPPPFPVPEHVTSSDGRYEHRFPVWYENAPLSTALYAYSPADTDEGWRQGYWDRWLSFPDVQPDAVLTHDFAVVRKCTFALTGRVVDAATNLPLAGASVTVSTSEDFDSATSTAAGAFSFPALLLGHNNAPTDYFVGASLLGYEFDFVDAEVTTCGSGHDATIRLTPLQYYFGSIEGFVRDEETGEPVAGMRVYLDFAVRRCGTPPELLAPCEAITDAAGHYRIGPVLTGNAPDDVYHAAVRTLEQTFPPVYYAASGGQVIERDQTAQLDLRVLRRRFARVEGHVRDQITRQPLAGARVTWGAGGMLTGGDGAYGVGGLSLGFRNAPTAVDGEASALGYWPATVDRLPIEADATKTHEFDLIPLCRDATVSGIVTDEETGARIAGAIVRGGGGEAVTAADGGYELGGIAVGNAASPVRVTLTAFKPGYHAASTDVTVFCGAQLRVDFTGAGSVSVTKTVDGTAPAAGQTFTFRLRLGAAAGVPGTLVAEAAAPAAGGGPVTFGNLDPGTYQLCEVVPAGWTSSLAAFTLPGGETCADTTVTPGATTAITVDNRPPAVDPPPTCTIEAQGALPDGRGFIRFRVQDLGSGLARYQVVYVRNATVSVSPFAVGTQEPVTVTATAITAGKSLGVTVEFFDVAGHKAVCDPIVHVVAHADDQPQDETFTGVPQAESKITILNGDPGMRRVRLVVNDVKFQEVALEPGEVRRFDVAAAMRPGDGNTITVSARGRKGATAVIVIADID